MGAVVVLRPGQEAGPEEIFGWSRERLAPYKRPRKWYVVEEFPMTASGKVQKFVLRRDIHKGELRPRAYAPVMLARVATQDADLHGRHVPAGDRILFPLAAANRDPEVYEDPHQVKLDRRRNAHLTFGSGAHRCLGSPLARLEMRVAMEEWLAVIPEFEVTDPDAIQWTGGTVRGPETVPFRVLR